LDANGAKTIRITALNEGTWGNKISASVEPAGNDRDLYKLVVRKENVKGEKVAVEAFDNLTIADIEETVNGKSAYIKTEKDDWKEGASGIVGSKKRPWISKFPQSVILTGGADAVVSPPSAAVSASAILRNTNNATAITVTAKTTGMASNGIIVTVTALSGSIFSIKISHPNGDFETFEGIDVGNQASLGINSAYVTLAGTTAPWYAVAPQSVNLDGTAANDVIKDEGNQNLIMLEARTGFTNSDITVTVEPGDDPGRFHMFIRHKNDPYEGF